MHGFKLTTAGMVVPDVIDGPEVIFADHGANAFDRRDSRTHAGFGIEAISPAAASGITLFAVGLALRSVLLPIAWSYVLIGPCHFYAAVAGDACGFAGSGRDDGIRPQQLFFDVEIHLFDIRRRRVIAAIEPHDHAGMAAQTIDLAAQRLLGDCKILRLPARPSLPEIAAAPSGHDENSVVVGDVEEFFGLQLAFETNGVQAHVFDVAEFIVQALGVFAKHHVGRPAAAADQDVFAVDVKGASTGGGYFRSDLADAELSLRLVAD